MGTILLRPKFVLSALLMSYQALSLAADNQAVEETARRTYTTAQDILSALKRCDADQSTLNLCAEYRFVEADLVLNDTYSALMRKMHGTASSEPLVRAQRAWIRFRDLDCEYQASSLQGGTMHAQWVLDCQRDRTVARTMQIESYLHCEANGCPGN